MEKDKYAKTLKKKLVIYNTIVILLFVALCFMIYRNFQITTINNYVEVGDNVIIKIKDNESSTCALSYMGKNLPNQKIEQSIKITSNAQTDIVIRAVAYITTKSGVKVPITIETLPNWQYNENDGYYYYNKLLKYQNSVFFSDSIILPENEKFPMQSDLNYEIIICIESLNSTYDVPTIWNYNTEYWLI